MTALRARSASGERRRGEGGEQLVPVCRRGSARAVRAMTSGLPVRQWQAGVRLLGPLEVGPVDDPVRVAATKPRTLLAALALHTGRPVSTDVLCETLWGRQPPRSAGKLLQTYVSQLRRLLPADLPLVTRAPGYALEIRPGQVDSEQFSAWAAAGIRARQEGRPADAARVLTAALDLWRGEPLGDVGPAVLFDIESARLAELRLGALHGLYAARLELGQAVEVLAALQVLAAAHRLHEGLQELWVLALYQSGRQAEAFAAYDATRTALRDQLGPDPGPGLRDLHRALLQQEPGLSVARRVQVSPLPAPIVPAPIVPARWQDRDGAVLVALEAVRELAQALTAVVAALGAWESGADAQATAPSELAELLRALSGLTRLVTSGAAESGLLRAAGGRSAVASAVVVARP
ncbi:MAG: AfsR/SARP family transcriptional regulator [Pseudorhodobacter sp.]|nr:AfsR/SARP family transcriptional regulator [Frankiaceae bacterium]